MSEIRFTRDHEWIRVENGVGTVGITDYAQGKLGDVVYVELPAVGRALESGAEAAVVESVKAASEVYTPAAGTVVAVNDALADDPALVNAAAEGDGWFFRIDLSDPAGVGALMDRAAYDAYVDGL